MQRMSLRIVPISSSSSSSSFSQAAMDTMIQASRPRLSLSLLDKNVINDDYYYDDDGATAAIKACRDSSFSIAASSSFISNTPPAEPAVMTRAQPDKITSHIILINSKRTRFGTANNEVNESRTRFAATIGITSRQVHEVLTSSTPEHVPLYEQKRREEAEASLRAASLRITGKAIPSSPKPLVWKEASFNNDKMKTDTAKDESAHNKKHASSNYSKVVTSSSNVNSNKRKALNESNGSTTDSNGYSYCDDTGYDTIMRPLGSRASIMSSSAAALPAQNLSKDTIIFAVSHVMDKGEDVHNK